MQRTGLAAATSASVRTCNAAQRGQRGTTVGSVPSSAVAMTDPVVLNSITQTPLHDRPCHMDCLLSERSNWRNRDGLAVPPAAYDRPPPLCAAHLAKSQSCVVLRD
jgi:hypothetical protein